MTDVLIINADLITMDPQNRLIGNAFVGMTGGRITTVGAMTDMPVLQPARTIDAQGAIVLPGFVNLHAHLAMTLLRGWADDRDLQDFLGRVIPTETAMMSPEFVRVGVDLAIAESLRAGITTTLDMYFYPEVTAERADRAGVRIANGPVIFSFDGPDGLDFAQRIKQAEAHLAESRGELTSGRWLCPHGTYTVAIEHLEAVRDLADRYDAGITIHAAENAAEVESVHAQTGRRPIELLRDLGLLTPRMVLAHAVELTDAEIEMIAESGASVSHNPLSNMKLASGFARVPDLLAAGVTVGLGTDGTASSNDLDLYGAVRFASTIHKGNSLDASAVSARQAVRMATIDGAKALGLGSEIGSIEVGKRADIQVLWADHPNLVPSYDPVSTVAFSAARGDVRMVVIEGRVVLDDGTLTTIDLPSTLGAARTMAQRVRATA